MASEAKAGSTGDNDPIILEGIIISSFDNKPIVGVSVYVEGTSIGTISNLDGKYELKVPPTTKQVTFKYIGFDTKKLDVSDLYLFKLVTMIERVNELEDVVVVGFGTQKKENVVGAVESIKPEDLSITSSNLSTSFVGKIAGVIGAQGSGEPGYDDVKFYIRGLSTFGANSDPLIVMDGVEILPAMLNNIPPETIESFSILKDATATSLYGSRGANGVIIVNTKTGHDAEKMKINVRFENTLSLPTKIQKIADGVTYMKAYNEAVKNSTPAGTPYVPFYSDKKIDGTLNKLNPYMFPDNDWYDMLFKDYAMNQNLNFNMTGGTKKINYFLSATIFNENGIIKKPAEDVHDVNMNNKKFLFQSNVSALVTPTTRVGLKMNSQLWYNDRPYENSANLFYFTMRANPVRFPAVLPAEVGDTFVRYGNNNSWDTGTTDLNPYARLAQGFANRYYSYLTTAINVEQDLSIITQGLSAKGMASFYNYTYSESYRHFTPFYFKVLEDYTPNPDGNYNIKTESIGDAGSTYLETGTSKDGHREYSVQASLDYARIFDSKHDINAMFVFHAKEKKLNTPNNSENDILPFRELGIAGRLSYNFDKRYFIEGTFGYNGSENFISGKRFGLFPSLAAGYTISNEKFFEPLKETINKLKFRVSYGLVGNDYLASRFPYMSIVDMNKAIAFHKGVNYSSTSGPFITAYGNENATWEEAKKFNAGIDLGLLNSSLNLTLDFYRERRSGIFMQRQSLPSSTGLSNSTPWANIGRVENKGVDLSVDYNKAIKKDFIVSLKGTFTYAHNEVREQDEPQLIYPYTSKVGHPINTIFGYVADGLFSSEEEIAQSPKQTMGSYTVGDIKYHDLNGDGVIDANDITAIGNPTLPEIIYGFGGGISYKKWDCSFYIQGTEKVSLQMANMHPFADQAHFGYNIAQYIVDNHWSESNPDANAKYPKLSTGWNVNNTQTSSYWLRNGAYLRLKSAEIGFRPNSIVRVYLAGSNLLTISPFKHWDPEMGGWDPTTNSGGNGLKYPLQMTVKAGVQLQF